MNLTCNSHVVTLPSGTLIITILIIITALIIIRIFLTMVIITVVLLCLKADCNIPEIYLFLCFYEISHYYSTLRENHIPLTLRTRIHILTQSKLHYYRVAENCNIFPDFSNVNDRYQEAHVLSLD